MGKNAAPKGYAFIEFAEERVAKIVGETMNKYLLFGKQLVCHPVPKEKQRPALWKGCNLKMKNREGIRREAARISFNDRPTVEVDGEMVPQATTTQFIKRNNKNYKLKAKLERLGIDFDLNEVVPDVDLKLFPGLRLKREGSKQTGAGSDAPGNSVETPPIAEGERRKKKRSQAPVDDADAGVLASKGNEKVGASAPPANPVADKEEPTPTNAAGKKRKKIRRS